MNYRDPNYIHETEEREKITELENENESLREELNKAVSTLAHIKIKIDEYTQ